MSSSADIPPKPRRRKHETPVKPTRKSFSANFHSKYYQNQQHGDAERPPDLQDSDTRSERVSKKHLKRENARLKSENQQLVSKFQELEELSVNKILRLKEKIGNIQVDNAELNKQNSELRLQYESLVMVNDDLRHQLELRKVCKKCGDLQSILNTYKADNHLLRKVNKELNEDLEMTKTVIYRLNVQLERYQEVLRNNNLIAPKLNFKETSKPENLDGLPESTSDEILSEVHRTHKHTPISWGSVNTHTLGPLLDAYEDTIKEKDEIIQNYEVEFSNFTGRLKEIVAENERLHERLTQDVGCSTKLKEEVVNLKNELQMMKNENDALIKKCALKQDKIEEILKTYEAKVGQMTRDFDVLHEEYIRIKTENATLHEKNKHIIEAQEDIKSQMENYIPISVHTSSVNECKKWYEELKQQYEKEKEKLFTTIDNHVKTIKSLNDEIDNSKKMKQDYETKTGQLEKHIKKLEAKQLELEHILNQVQLSRSALRKQLHKAMCFAKELVQEQETLLTALNQRNLENKAVKKIGSDTAARMDTLKVNFGMFRGVLYKN
ncbi:unnamed protein product [Acanthoscelides obtectus]|uniref:Uncharacterized protein n=1 Tax=Acanthoscelides obtectus TaxID=200917 RepID=A0A9P0Q695_ACAOB|nr:unnamed protein product [Acanthoscelides obtectus]CAK1674311.1 Protein Cep89 homolog [Acanthoscelides obtectus]